MTADASTFGVRTDDAGWYVGPVAALAQEEAYSLFVSDAAARFNESALRATARMVMAVELSLTPPKSFPSGSAPNADMASLTLRGNGLPDSVVVARLMPIERATSLRRHAVNIGRGGMETLAERARKLVQIERASQRGDPRAPMVCAAIFASAFLAPILPFDEQVLFGIKGAKERLAAAGFTVP